MKSTYKMSIAGVEKELALCPLNDSLKIAGFIIFGDVELTVACAKELLAKAPKHDVILTAESKGITLVYEMARQEQADNFIIARKSKKLYMNDVLKVQVKSITTDAVQTLCLDTKDAAYLKGKRVLIIDDVISTGESLRAMEALVNEAGGNIVGKGAVLAEGKAADRDDIFYLEYLPLFDTEGNPLPR